MMLFRMKSEKDSVHWTEIYTIVTISAMLIEDFRKVSRIFPIILLFRYESGYNMIIVRRQLLHKNVRKMAFVEYMDAAHKCNGIYSFLRWHWTSFPLNN